MAATSATSSSTWYSCHQCERASLVVAVSVIGSRVAGCAVKTRPLVRVRWQSVAKTRQRDKRNRGCVLDAGVLSKTPLPACACSPSPAPYLGLESDYFDRASSPKEPEGKRMASGHTGNVVPGNRLRVRLPCPPLKCAEKMAGSRVARRGLGRRCRVGVTGSVTFGDMVGP